MRFREGSECGMPMALSVQYDMTFSPSTVNTYYTFCSLTWDLLNQ